MFPILSLDTNPLSLNPKLVIRERLEEFKLGLKVLSSFPKHKLYLCKDLENIELPDLKNLKPVEVSGIHPAGNVGTHIHF